MPSKISTANPELEEPQIKQYLSFWAEHAAALKAKEKAHYEEAQQKEGAQLKDYLEFWEEIETNYEFNDTTAKVTIR